MPDNGRPELPKRTPKRVRVYMGEGHRLRDEPTYDQMRYAMVTGIKMKNGVRLKLPSRRSRSRRWTTIEAYEWWLDKLEE